MSKDIYCTYLTVYSGNKLPPLYIGSTSIERIQKGYHGTVTSIKYKQIWKSELKENPHLFKTEILTTHKTREEAFEEEMNLQQQFDVVKSSLYINMAIANKKLIFTDSSDAEWKKRLLLGMSTPEYKKKQSEAMKKRWESDEYKKFQSENNKGRKRSKESRIKSSISAKKRFESEEERMKISNALKGKEKSQEHRNNLKGKKSEEHKEKISKIHKGKIITEEQKRKQSEAMKMIYKSEDHRKKMSESIKNGWTDEVRKKKSESQKGKFWFYNLESNTEIFCYPNNVPSGFIKGRKKRKI